MIDSRQDLRWVAVAHPLGDSACFGRAASTRTYKHRNDRVKAAFRREANEAGPQLLDDLVTVEQKREQGQQTRPANAAARTSASMARSRFAKHSRSASSHGQACGVRSRSVFSKRSRNLAAKLLRSDVRVCAIRPAMTCFSSGPGRDRTTEACESVCCFASSCLRLSREVCAPETVVQRL